MRSPADGSTGAHSTRSHDASCVASSPSISWASAVSTDRRRVRGGVHRRDAEQHRVVTELQVGVDERDPSRQLRGQHDRKVRGDHALADAALGREGDDDLAELLGLGRGRARDTCVTSASPTRAIDWRI